MPASAAVPATRFFIKVLKNTTTTMRLNKPSPAFRVTLIDIIDDEWGAHMYGLATTSPTQKPHGYAPSPTCCLLCYYANAPLISQAREIERWSEYNTSSVMIISIHDW